MKTVFWFLPADHQVPHNIFWLEMPEEVAHNMARQILGTDKTNFPAGLRLDITSRPPFHFLFKDVWVDIFLLNRWSDCDIPRHPNGDPRKKG